MPSSPPRRRPSGLSEAEQKLYDLVVRRFMAVFFPSAEYQVTTRISQVAQPPLQDRGQGAGQARLAGHLRQGSGQRSGRRQGRRQGPAPGAGASPAKWSTPAGRPGQGPARPSRPRATPKPRCWAPWKARASRSTTTNCARAMQEKGLGTPATRAAIIEGLLTEKYMLREGREIIPTAKAFQLMTLLRGLEVQELCRAELTGEWEYKLAQMEKGQLSREAFMQEIAAMTERMVQEGQGIRPRHHPRRLRHAAIALPQLRRRGEGKLPPLRLRGPGRARRGLRLLASASRPPAAPLKRPRPSSCCATRRSARWRASAPRRAGRSPSEIVIKYDDEAHNYKLEFDFGDDKNGEESGELVEFEDGHRWAPAPSAARKCTSTAATTCAARPCPPPHSPRPVAPSRAARSSCSSPWSASR